MIVYGGYSQLCGDYCSDVWHYNLSSGLRSARPSSTAAVRS